MRVTAFAVLAFCFVTPAAAQTAPAPPPAVEDMSRQQLRDEVTRLRTVVQNGAVRPQRPAGCTAAENRQFDFWLGEWDVLPSSSQSGVLVAESTISLHDQGCVIMEEWRPFAGAHGHSINIYDATDQNWHQVWMDATGRRTVYRGVLQDDVLRMDNLNPLPDQNGNPQRLRMSFQALDANTVRQWGERFDEASSQWTVAWDLTYRRRANTAPGR